MVLSLKNYHFRKSIPLEGTFAPTTRNSVIATENKRPHIMANKRTCLPIKYLITGKLTLAR